MRLALLFLSSIIWFDSLSVAQTLLIHHINVGQGDATLIQVSRGKTVLIDAGNVGKGKNAVLPYLSGLGITSLDYLIASHYHADHIGGLPEVIEGLSADSVREVYDRGSVEPLPASTTFTKYWEAVDRTPKRSTITVGQTLSLSNRITLRCVAVNGTVAGHGPVPGSNRDENDLSMAWVLTSEQPANDRIFTFRYFTGGDCGGSGGDYADLETPLSPIVADIDAMKINHHGSRYSTNRTFLDSLRPEAVVISVGDRNRYGHPAQETLDRLQNTNSVRYVYQTENANGGSAQKVKELGTVTIAVYDSFYVVLADTFRLTGEPARAKTNHLTNVTTENNRRKATSETRMTVEGQKVCLTVYEPCFITIRLYSILGQVVSDIASGYYPRGEYVFNLRDQKLSSAAYFLRLSTPSEVVVRKVIVLH